MKWLAENAEVLAIIVPVIAAAVIRFLQKLGKIQKERADVLTESVEDLGGEIAKVIDVLPLNSKGVLDKRRLSKLVARTAKNLVRKKLAAKSASVAKAMADGAAQVDPDPAKRPRPAGRLIRDLLIAMIPGR